MSVTVVLLAIVVLILFQLRHLNLKDYVRNTYYLMKLPGPRMIPIFGYTFKLATLKIEDLMSFLLKIFTETDHLVAMWVAGVPVAAVTDVEDCEALLGNTQYIKKGLHYDPIKSWLNEGLLTSSGEKWHQRRKMLTPAFHFKILEEALPIMNKNAKLLVKKVLAQNGQTIEISKFVNLCTLDVICESAMGVKLDAQNNKSSQYVSDIAEISEILMKRNIYFWLLPDLTFYLTPTGFRFKKVLKRLHEFTENVIHERKALCQKELKTQSEENKGKKRKAFLDFLIQVEMNNPGTFTHEDMREEVDTFMFEVKYVMNTCGWGHDTTSAALVHAMMFIGGHPEVQDKLVAEMEDIFGNSNRDITYNDLPKMKYLEQVIKETLRILPSVPIFTRVLEKDFVTSKGYLIPKMTNMVMCPNIYHFSEEVYPNTRKFDPERFSEENMRNRHPFAFIPFSAGARNCIGQKFAMLEMKAVLSTAIRHLNFKTEECKEFEQFCPLLIVRALEPILMQFTPRNLISS